MATQAGDTLLSKPALRAVLRLRRAQLPAADRQRAALAATQRIRHLRAWQRAQHIGVYWACASELPTQPLIAAARAQHKTLYLPQIGAHGVMRFLRFDTHTPLRHNRHGIAEPCGQPRCSGQRLDLLIVPLLGFDAEGYRLGAGGGYYDRYLARRLGAHPLCLGWAFAEQQLSTLPREPWDQRLDGIVTQRGVLWPTG